jgi:hypothetical protein
MPRERCPGSHWIGDIYTVGEVNGQLHALAASHMGKIIYGLNCVQDMGTVNFLVTHVQEGKILYHHHYHHPT